MSKLIDVTWPKQQLGLIRNPSAPHSLEQFQEFWDDPKQDSPSSTINSEGGVE